MRTNPPIVNKFINEVLGLDVSASIELALDYRDELRKNFSLTTARTYISLMRAGLPDDHPARAFCALTDGEYNELDARYAARVKKRAENPFQGVSVSDFIGRCESLVEGYNVRHRSRVKLALGIAGLTGRRLYSEIMAFGMIRPAGASKLKFYGQAKTPAYKPAYIIPCLSESDFICEAWDILRESTPAQSDNPDVDAILKNRLPLNRHKKSFWGNIRELRAIADHTAHINSAHAGRAVRSELSNFGVTRPHDLRALYAACCYQKNRMIGSRNHYFSEILGHADGDIKTAESYKTFNRRQ